MKAPWTLIDEAQSEAYEYFDKNIRELSKDSNGKIDPAAADLYDNDVDAFRHAYASGVFTQEYSESAADILGRLNELSPGDLYSNSKNPRAKNMDLWNNSIGRKCGKKAKNRKDLLKKVHEALKRGDLITTPDDEREYSGIKTDPKNSKPVIVLKENKNVVLSKAEFISLIQEGKYPGYSIKTINGGVTPVSNPDGKKINNLG